MLPPFSWAEQILLVLPAQGDAAELDPTWRKYLEESCTQSNHARGKHLHQSSNPAFWPPLQLQLLAAKYSSAHQKPHRVTEFEGLN